MRHHYPRTAVCKACQSVCRRWTGDVESRGQLKYICTTCRPARVINVDGNTFPGTEPGAQAVKPLPVKSSDHLGWAEHWGESALRALDAYLAPTGAALHLENAVRYARQAWFRAATAKKYRYWEAGYVFSVLGQKEL